MRKNILNVLIAKIRISWVDGRFMWSNFYVRSVDVGASFGMRAIKVNYSLAAWAILALHTGTLVFAHV